MGGHKTNSAAYGHSDPNNNVNHEARNREGRIALDSSQDYASHLEELKKTGLSLRSDRDQPALSAKPDWFDEQLFRRARSVYERHLMGINFAHLSGLLLLVRVPNIYETLSLTGQSDSVSKLFRRYYNTVKRVKSWYEGDIFEQGSDAHRSLLIVRGMHNRVSAKYNDSIDASAAQDTSPTCSDVRLNTSLLIEGAHGTNNHLQNHVHISEYDIMLTQFAFVGFIILKSTQVGLIEDFSDEDLASLLHFWRVIGYYLGASNRYNLCSYKQEDIVGLCEAIIDKEYKESMRRFKLEAKPGIMSVNIIRSVKFIPMLTIYGMMRHLYEVLGNDTSELEHKRNWYSNLSYTLIKLVMTRLLAYKPFRSFNNGLTRLSLYLVGHVDHWFENRLEAQYGVDMRL